MSSGGRVIIGVSRAVYRFLTCWGVIIMKAIDKAVGRAVIRRVRVGRVGVVHVVRRDAGRVYNPRGGR